MTGKDAKPITKLPYTAKCPECGREMDLTQDSVGYIYACHGHDCWSQYAADELFPLESEPE